MAHEHIHTTAMATLMWVCVVVGGAGEWVGWGFDVRVLAAGARWLACGYMCSTFGMLASGDKYALQVVLEAQLQVVRARRH